VAPALDCQTIAALANSKSALSETALLKFLDSPDFTVRARALNALRDLAELGPTARSALCREIRENGYTTAYLAAEIAGEKNVQEAVPALTEVLASDDVYLVGKSMVALVRLQATQVYPTIAQIQQQTSNPRLAIHSAAALAQVGDYQYLTLLLAKSTESSLPSTVQAELLYQAGRLAGCGDTVYQFVTKWRAQPASAALLLQEQLQLGDIPSQWQSWQQRQNLADYINNQRGDEPLGQIVTQFLQTVPAAALTPELLGCLWLIVIGAARQCLELPAPG